jgi:hypothetical protein
VSSLKVLLEKLKKRKSWREIIVVSVLGGVVGALMASTIGVVAPVGLRWLIANNVLSGVLGSVMNKVAVVTRLANNLSNGKHYVFNPNLSGAAGMTYPIMPQVLRHL